MHVTENDLVPYLLSVVFIQLKDTVTTVPAAVSSSLAASDPDHVSRIMTTTGGSGAQPPLSRPFV